MTNSKRPALSAGKVGRWRKARAAVAKVAGITRRFKGEHDIFVKSADDETRADSLRRMKRLHRSTRGLRNILDESGRHFGGTSST